MILRTIAFSILIFYSSVHAQTDPGTYWSVKRLVEHHMNRHSAMEVEDVYKMLHQANLGIEHMLGDTAAVRSFLLQELSSLTEAFPGEPLIERISSDGRIVRINLRPFKQSGMDPDLLVQSMFASAAAIKPDTLMFKRQWNEFAGLAKYGFLNFNVDDVQAYSERIASNILSPGHHSQPYEKANQPAYRVVRKDVFEKTAGNLEQP